MGREELETSPINDTPAKLGRRRVLIAVILVAGAATFFFRPIARRWGCAQAEDLLAENRVGEAEQWLDRTTRLSGNSWQISLLRAKCFRAVTDKESWQFELERARNLGADEKQLNLEIAIGESFWGEGRATTQTVDSFTALGASLNESVESVIRLELARGRVDQARQVLEEFSNRIPASSHLFLTGLIESSTGEWDAAIATFRKLLQDSPHYEPARVTLADCLKKQLQLAEATDEYRHLFEVAPRRRSVRITYSETLRKQGLFDPARKLMAPLIEREAGPLSVPLEAGFIEYEAGNITESIRWFRMANLDRQLSVEVLRTAGTAHHLAGEVEKGQELLNRAIDGQKLFRLSQQWQQRLSRDQNDAVAENEFRQLTASRQKPLASTSTQLASSQSYLRHCAACHGDHGDGQGPASNHLFPPARNLKNDSFRLVSTVNKVASQQDIEKVIRQGIPGTSMVGFNDLPNAEINEIVDQVIKFREMGAKERMKSNSEISDTISDDELSKLVEALITPEHEIELPEFPETTPQLVSAGQKLFVSAGCIGCHNEQHQTLDLFDENGIATSPRDLRLDPMKGGNDAESLAWRVLLGMPGSAHPALPSLPDDELIALIAYCQSLQGETKRVLTNHQRSRLASGLR